MNFLRLCPVNMCNFAKQYISLDDHSRVKLPAGQDDESDYINASFIDVRFHIYIYISLRHVNNIFLKGFKHKGKFIAAQGPKLNTIDDFWHMVWGQNVSVIIMVTNLDERSEEKCARYWPMSGREIYDDVAVTLVGENHLVDFSIRKFTLQQVYSLIPVNILAGKF